MPRAKPTPTLTGTSRMTDTALGPLLLAMRLGSAALPIGAFAYSQALEHAVAVGAVRDASSAERWILGMLERSVLTNDVPFLVSLHAAWSTGDEARARVLGDALFATRATRELREEERQLGRALFRLAGRLGVDVPASSTGERATLASAFALVAARGGIDARMTAASYAFAWAEAQVGAATRLVPLGQSEAQLVLSAASSVLARDLDAAVARNLDEATSTAPGQAILSAAHETLHSRIFRS